MDSMREHYVAEAACGCANLRRLVRMVLAGSCVGLAACALSDAQICAGRSIAQ